MSDAIYRSSNIISIFNFEGGFYFLVKNAVYILYSEESKVKISILFTIIGKNKNSFFFIVIRKWITVDPNFPQNIYRAFAWLDILNNIIVLNTFAIFVLFLYV